MRISRHRTGFSHTWRALPGAACAFARFSCSIVSSVSTASGVSRWMTGSPLGFHLRSFQTPTPLSTAHHASMASTNP